MAIMAIYRSDKVTPADFAPYEAELAGEPLPPGARHHFVGYDGRELTVVDVWESRRDLEAYTAQVQDRMRRHQLPDVTPEIHEIQHVLQAP